MTRTTKGRNDDSAAAGSRVGRVGVLPVQGQLVAVRVSADRGHRVVVVDDAGAQQAIAPARLLWLGQGSATDADSLRRYWERVEQLATEREVPPLWTSLRDAGHLEPIAPRTLLARAGEPRPAPEQVDALVVAVFRDRIHFKVKGDVVVPGQPAKVEAALATAEAKRQAAADRIHVKATLASWLDGLRPAAIDPVVRARLDGLWELAVQGKNASCAPQANGLLEDLGRRAGPQERRALQLLIDLGEMLPFHNLAPERAGLERSYPAAVTEAAHARIASPPRQHAPRDLTHLLTVAIDDARTTEVDDAFAIDGDRLMVFIADVAAFVSPGDAVDGEAARRTATVYVPEGKLTMLPSVLGEDAASLHAGAVRPALCFSGVPGPDGDLTDFAVCEALCRVDVQLTYDQADEVLADPGSPSGGGGGRGGTGGGTGIGAELAGLLTGVQAWMRAHRAWRERRGAVSFQRSEVGLEANPATGEVQLIRGHPNGASRQLVSELMVAVGAGAGRLCADQAIPCIFRGQPAPEVPVTAADLDGAGPAVQAAVLRSFRPSLLSTRPTRHFSLGLDAYTQVTSPLRRYQDLLVHFGLKRWLAGEPSEGPGQLRRAFDALEQRSSLNRRVESESRRYWLLRWLERHASEDLDAVVLRPLSKRWLVELTDLALHVAAPLAPTAQPGAHVRLRVAQVDARADVLELVPA